MRILLALVLVACALGPLPASAQEAGADPSAVREVRRVVEEAYVQGVWVARDRAAVRSGFHPDFVMWVNDGGRLVVVSLESWLERLGLDGEPSVNDVRPVFRRIDVTGNTAVVSLELWVQGERRYIDHLALYRLAEGWRIVAKVFEPGS